VGRLFASIGTCAGFLIASGTGVGQGYTIDTFAGSDFTGDQGMATLAILHQAEGIAFDFAGNLYIADAADHRIRKVTRAGVITTFAGTGIPGFSGDGGPAAAAQLNSPYGLLFDGLGDLFVADLGNARVREITPDGTIATVAGGGALTPGGMNEGTAANLIALNAPRNLAFDNQGALYFSDFTGQRVFRIDSGGNLTTFAGTGVPGFSGDYRLAARAELAYPAGLAFDRNGVLYIADSQNHLIRKVVSSVLSTFAHASTPSGMVMDSFSTLYVADPGAGGLLTFPLNSPAATCPIASLDVTFRGDGFLYASQGATVLRFSFAGASATVAGGGSLASGDQGPATNALLHHPSGVAPDALGNVYIADRDNNRIRRVAPDGTITTVAGTGDPGTPSGANGDGGPAILAQLNQPSSVTVDGFGNLYVADTGSHRVREITVAGIILPVPVTGLIAPVYALADRAGDVYVADVGLNAIVKMSPLGVVSTIAAQLSSPGGFVFDAAGTLYFTETGAARVSRLDILGNLTAIASGVWNTPRGVALGTAGDVFVADNGLQRVMHVDAAGLVTTIAGTGAAGFAGDGGDALSAQFYDPWALAMDPTGFIYVADFTNNRVRRLTPVSPVAGNP
jgi:sugar lactone lactonase YvrE